MKDIWYGDRKDLVKWGGIIHLCSLNGIKTIVQVAYYRSNYQKDEWPRILFDGTNDIDLPREVVDHFRNIEDIKRLGHYAGLDIRVIKKEFNHKARKEYGEGVCNKIRTIRQRKIVFLDPDTGLAPTKCKAEHVARDEVSAIWRSLNVHDILVFYQHRFWLKSGDWREIRRNELATSCGVETSQVRMWSAKKIPNDVVFFFIEKGAKQSTATDRNCGS